MAAVLDRAGVEKIVLMANGKSLEARDRTALAAYEKYPDRVVPFLGLNGYRKFDPQLLEYLDRQLSTGKFLGMGELLSRHYSFSTVERGGATLEAGDYTIPMDSPKVLDLMCLAAKHNVVLVVHMETTAETVPALERALRANPNTKVIWAHQTHLKTLDGSTEQHARKADPGQIAGLLDEYANLFVDVAPGFESRYLTRGDGNLSDPWRDLYERYNDRFVVGLDQPFLEQWGDVGRFVTRANLVRRWLSQLSPAAQRKLATENMERILGLELSSGRECQYLTR